MYTAINDFFRIVTLDEVVSTNDTVKSEALAGAKEGFTVIARRQTGGRGRMGRSFFSPDGGLYMSVLLRPHISPEKTLRITTMAAVAVCEAIEIKTGKKAGIKWVNDIITDGKKVCGILTQSVMSSQDRVDFCVLGIGVNVLSPVGGFPPEIKDKAGALYSETCPAKASEKIARGILDRLYYHYSLIDKGLYADEYRRRSTVLGRVVDIIPKEGEPIKARVTGIDDDCALEVEYADGSKGKLTSGEVGVGYE